MFTSSNLVNSTLRRGETQQSSEMAEKSGYVCPRRKALKVAMGALCSEAGFSYAEDAVLETLTEMVQSYIFEVGRSTRAFSELSCRAEPMLSDVAMSLVEMGTDIESIPAYAKRRTKPIEIKAPLPSTPAAAPRTLSVGEKSNQPSHIPQYLPSFPDPHTYNKTFTHREPESDYQSLREKAASQKRDVERALTRFIAKTGETESLFPDDPYAFPLIANKPKPLPYLDALLPKEQDFEGAEDPNKSDQPILRPVPQEAPSKEPSQPNESSPSSKTTTNATADPSTLNTSGAAGNAETGGAAAPEQSTSEPQIDNPYLRAIIMPKIGRTMVKKTLAATTSAYKW